MPEICKFLNILSFFTTTALKQKTPKNKTFVCG